MKKNLLIAFLLIITLALSACSGSADMDAGIPQNEAGEAAAADDAPMEAPAFDGAAEGRDEIARMPEDSFTGGSESYLTIDENRQKYARDESVVTFSLKVDTAAYSNVARYIESGNLPPADAVRVEELINYFSYDAAPEFDGHPFSVYTEVGPSPFDESKRMAMIRVKAQDMDREELPSSNLTFLIDTSGSMNSYDKLPLLKQSFGMLVETLTEDDMVSIVTYAGSSAVVLDSVSGADKDAILAALNSLSAGGSTAGEGGIRAAYALAEKNFMAGGNNRVILASDGDFNVGTSNLEELEALVTEKREGGVYLSILGFGTGNLRDDIMETLATHGNGNYSYIDSVATANKVLVEELGSNLYVIADDVKAQVEFNPANVVSYRLIGYENRQMANEDFQNDQKDAGEIGVGTDVVMLFELELAGDGEENGELKYQDGGSTDGAYGDELFEVRIRYKNPGESESIEMVQPVTVNQIAKRTSSDYNFACSVAAFGHLLRDSAYSGEVTIDDIISMAKSNLGDDEKGYRLDHVLLLQQYKRLTG